MARKSRKNLEVTFSQEVGTKSFNVGAYIRLSAVDKKNKGDSIETQQAIISAFIAEHTDLEMVDTYIDNGLSGQSFQRPSFQRMISDIESGKINCCITKDLSRLGRNAIDTGFYIEKYFPTNGVRYIAITDDYDSEDSRSGGIMISLKNMVNEAYALDIGRRIRATKQMNIRNGCFVGRIAPYGYFKSNTDRHKLVPDEYASRNVLHMFEMAASGKEVSQILQWLNQNEILPPKRYLHSLGLATEKESSGHIHWNKGVVYSILCNQIYCGDMVQGKYKTQSYVQTKLPKSEWVITKNTHEKIVSRELFAQVQMLTNKKDKQSKSPNSSATTENIFLRKIFCGHCGYAMIRHRSTETNYRFNCATKIMYDKHDCVKVSINERKLKDTLLKVMQEQKVKLNDTLSLKDVRQQNNEKIKDELLSLQSEINKSSHFFNNLYESLIMGDITKDEYKTMKTSYEDKITMLEDKENVLRETALQRTLQENQNIKAIENIESVQDTTNITKEVLNRLVEKIMIYKDESIGVKFKFMDEVLLSKGGEKVE